MSNPDRVPRRFYALHRHTPKAPQCAGYRPVASYDQMLAFVVKVRSVLATASLDSMTYILANQEPLHDVRVFIQRLSDNFNQAALACHEAQKRSEEVARNFQQAWDLVDIKVNDVAAHSRYINTISQELGETWRTHTSPPNKHWRIVCLSLASELKEAVETRYEMRWNLLDTERRAEKWEARYILAVGRWCDTYQDAMQLQDALTAIHTEFLAGQSLAKIFMRELQEDRDGINDRSESDGVWRINQALAREEEREVKEYGAISRFKKRPRGA